MQKPLLEQRSAATEEKRKFYEEMWSSDGWGALEPNEEEGLRAAKILTLIEERVLLALPERPRILDLGCGRGWLTSQLAAYGEITGVDPVPEAIERARKLFPRIRFQAGISDDVLAAEGRGTFHLVVSSEVIEHVEDADKPAFIQSIYDLLGPEGFAVLSTPRGELWEDWQRHNPDGQPVEAWIRESDLRQLSTSVGFRVVAQDRLFVPRLHHSRLSLAVNQRPIRRAMAYFPNSNLFALLRHRAATYQIIVLQRPRG